MNKELKNVEEYILALLAVCGEVKALGIGRKMPFTETYVLRTLAEMTKDGLIRKYEYDDGRFYRLSKKGMALIESDFSELVSHLDLLIGEKGQRYKGTKEKRKRRRHSLEIAALGISENMDVDFFGLSPNRITWEDFAGKSADEIIAKIDPNKKTFITKRMLYGKGDVLETHPRNHMFRTIGVFFSGANVFPAYYMDAPGERYRHDVELSFVNLLTKSVKVNYRDNMERLSGIFYTGKDTIMRDFLFPSKKTYRFMPNTVYNIYYMLPMNKSVEATTSLILTPAWREKVNNLLIESPGGRAGDGTTFNGTPVYNFLGNNIVYMKKNAPALQNNEGVLIIHDWQIDIAKRLFGEKHELRVVEEDMLRAILQDIGI